MKKTVEFLRAFSPYGVSDVAGFSPEKADALVRAGYAKHVGVVTDGLPLTESAGETEIGREMNKDPKSAGKKLGPRNAAVSTEGGGSGAPEAEERADKADKRGKKGSKPAPSKRRARNRIMDTD